MPKKVDPLEEPQGFNFGKFQCQCIDSCRFRPARILSRPSPTIPTPKTEVGNILHLGSFHKGTIPLDAIKNVEVGFEEFLPAIYHVILKFQLKDAAPPLRLFNQSKIGAPAVETRTLVLSPEGVPPKDHRYSIVEGYFGHYLMANRLVTGQEMERWLQELKHPIKFFPLQLTPEQAAKILLRSLEESDLLRLDNA